jgi:hypothetical protein
VPRARGRASEHRNGGIGARLLALAVSIVAAVAIASATDYVQTARGGELATGGVPAGWRAPHGWLVGALCIHRHEGGFTANTGNGYYGGFQFLLGTWRSVGGRVRPDLASPREQLYRAWLVYRRDGMSWREWGTARLCGLR